MYKRIISKRVASLCAGVTANTEIANDKSGIVFKGIRKGTMLETPAIHSKRSNAIHLVINPALGKPEPILITPDDGQVSYTFKVKATEEELEALDYHFKVLIVGIDLLGRD